MSKRLAELIEGANGRVQASTGNTNSMEVKEEEVAAASVAAFEARIRRHLGPEIVEALGDIRSDSPSAFGPAVEFTVDGSSFWLEQACGGFVDLVRGKEMKMLCRLDLDGIGGRDMFLHALGAALTSPEGQ